MAELPLIHTPDVAANRARQRSWRGEHKCDLKETVLIAEFPRTRPDLRALLCVPFPASERRVAPTIRTGLPFLSRHPAAKDNAGVAKGKHMVVRLARIAIGLRNLEALVQDADRIAQARNVVPPGACPRASIIAKIVPQALAARDRFKATDQAIWAWLAVPPDAAVILSMPRTGAILTAEFVAPVGRIVRSGNRDALAVAAGFGWVLCQSGKTRSLLNAAGGGRVLKRVFWQVARTSLGPQECRPVYHCQRAKEKRHHQGVIALRH